MGSVAKAIKDKVQTVYTDYNKLKTLVDLGYFLDDYVYSGGVVTKDATCNNIINVTAIVASVGNDVSQHDAASFKSATASTTYYLDYLESGSYSWATAHPSGTYVAVAEVTTDANGNVDTITDKRTGVGTVQFTGDISGDGVKISDLAPIASPAFTGSPTAPTQSAGDNSTKLATTGYADAAAGEVADDLTTHESDTTPHKDASFLDIIKLQLKTSTILTIASGAITVTQGYHRVDTESAASSDDLDTINGGTAGQILVMTTQSSSRSVTIKHNTGNIITFDGVGITLGSSTAVLCLIYSGTFWLVLPTGVKRSGDTMTGNLDIKFNGASMTLLDSSSTASARIQSASNVFVVQERQTSDNTFLATRFKIDLTTGDTTPGADNTQDLGSASLRWKEVFAGTGTINTSDENEKEQIEDLDTAEKAVAVTLKGLIKKFKFKDAVAAKGDDARIHVGVIAQDVQDAFTAQGLDAADYGVFCSDTWWEKEETRTSMVDNPDYDPEQPESDDNPKQIAGESYTETVIYSEEVEGGTEKTRLGVRYDELFAFIIAAL